MADNRKLRILCIHGYRQNGQSFREKTGALRKITKKYAELDYITAPHRVPPGNMGRAAWKDNPGLAETEEAQEADPGERGWWFSREDEYFKSTDYSDVSIGFEDSVDMICQVLETGTTEIGKENTQVGGYDGIIAFSQGASLLSMLSLIQQKEQKQWFKFAILVAGFKSRSSKHSHHYNGQATIPSLHVFGETDQIVSPEMSEELLQYFESPTVLRHPGGHYVPAAGPQKRFYVEFLEEMLKL
ncbi:ovarian cancer-associated gene 2 protein homolog [Plakobranchus ocellatus]|uniref:Ovarian cancer-associated gene 2 protein homolog n=1 Tax=Plakobranchus ocellatus TaxID=259542 RepID=A0AAV4B7X1_9GAST|nr:ovarian cancer-associated gene 2 protein homolog [Plakobranchus ocellatus]